MGEEIFGEAEYFTEGLQLEVLPKILVRESVESMTRRRDPQTHVRKLDCLPLELEAAGCAAR